MLDGSPEVRPKFIGLIERNHIGRFFRFQAQSLQKGCSKRYNILVLLFTWFHIFSYLLSHTCISFFSTAVAQVERWMEELHNRRRMLDVTWQRRKLNLEKHRTMSILKCDLELLESLIRERYELLSRVRNELGDSASSAQFMLEQHQQLIPEATVNKSSL